MPVPNTPYPLSFGRCPYRGLCQCKNASNSYTIRKEPYTTAQSGSLSKLTLTPAFLGLFIALPVFWQFPGDFRTNPRLAGGQS